MTSEQAEVCRKYGVEPCEPLATEKVGIARNVLEGVLPINGLRHRPSVDTCGWYIWGGGEIPDHDNFFVPLHVSHLGEWCPSAVRFLALPPGFRFLVAEGYEDVWRDEGLL
ncbi:MAG: hypothetical protein HY962_02380 [Ignavibacteriae bacterium]|nr:hypothetical protein [Ignavibacteriota bacterium]